MGPRHKEIAGNEQANVEAKTVLEDTFKTPKRKVEYIQQKN
jgi:hypothetical protein